MWNKSLVATISRQIGRVQRQPRNVDKSTDADGLKGPNGPLQREAFIAALVGVSATLGMDVLCSKVRKLLCAGLARPPRVYVAKVLKSLFDSIGPLLHSLRGTATAKLLTAQAWEVHATEVSNLSVVSCRLEFERC